jgi:hypothetical protein
VKEFAASGVPVHQKYLADAGMKELTEGLAARLKMPG